MKHAASFLVILPNHILCIVLVSGHIHSMPYKLILKVTNSSF